MALTSSWLCPYGMTYAPGVYGFDETVFSSSTLIKFVIVSSTTILVYPSLMKKWATSTGLCWRFLDRRRLYAKFRKCEFWLQQVAFLGLLYCRRHHYGSQKVEAITKWLETLLQVTELMRKGEKFVWTDERQESFEELKRRCLFNFLVCSDIDSIHSGSRWLLQYITVIGIEVKRFGYGVLMHTMGVSCRGVLLIEDLDSTLSVLSEDCDIFSEHKRCKPRCTEDFERSTFVWWNGSMIAEDVATFVIHECIGPVRQQASSSTDGQSEGTLESLEEYVEGLFRHSEELLVWDQGQLSPRLLVRLRFWNVLEKFVSSGSSSAVIDNKPDMSLSEEPESILDGHERIMRNIVIPFVKILWKNSPEREIPKGFDKVLWGDLIVMFNPDEQDEFWNSQHEWKVVSWKLHSSSGVHTLMTDEGLVVHMLIEKKYPLKKEILMQMLKLKLESEEESTMALELIRFIKKSWLVQDQTVLGKDYSNLLIADSLLKTIWFINAPCYDNEALASPNTNDEELSIPEQTATGKGTSNPLMAGSLPKTTKPT
ncbi:hypothetical protein Tco_0560872 [Tanacetum coccineum]